MESKLQYAHGWLGRRMHGGSYGWRPDCYLLPEHKSISDGAMGSKMTKMVLIFQLAFFFFAGVQIVSHERECAKTEAMSAILVSMPLESLSEVRI